MNQFSLPLSFSHPPNNKKHFPRDNRMSLLDALLLDPYRINVWIAYRTDVVNGSGTQNDPYDGSTNLAAAITVSSLTKSGQEATATASGHGYSDNDVVTIDGAIVGGTTANPFNGTFVIYGVSGSIFKYRMIASPAT
jgi:hypothetical protein